MKRVIPALVTALALFTIPVAARPPVLAAGVTGGVWQWQPGSAAGAPPRRPQIESCLRSAPGTLIATNGSTDFSPTNRGQCLKAAIHGYTIVAADLAAPCLHGGYRDVYASSRASFSTEAACVLYIGAGGSLTGPLTLLGGLDLQSYCVAHGYVNVYLSSESDPYGWYCLSATDSLTLINITSACVWQYPSSVDVSSSRNRSVYPAAFGWVCYGRAAL